MKLEYDDDRTPVVRTIVRRDDGKILVLRKQELGKWELPGGKIEYGEDRFEASSRELQEETDLEAKDFTDIARVEIEDENGCANAYIVYTEEFEGEAEDASSEHDEFKWVKPENYSKLDFHYHSAYSVPAVGRLEKYLEDREV
jgi:8-oxo-dGTP diphosphatase